MADIDYSTSPERYVARSQLCSSPVPDKMSRMTKSKSGSGGDLRVKPEQQERMQGTRGSAATKSSPKAATTPVKSSPLKIRLNRITVRSAPSSPFAARQLGSSPGKRKQGSEVASSSVETGWSQWAERDKQQQQQQLDGADDEEGSPSKKLRWGNLS
ncbi:uncharacterized protein B0I36DRAFT_360428 [Microdochium trichocladiopsis]|uniref:Uncharacterized protein n=1 Tax=Microdochium trichocladiopsis TaxID=1682393 RepID=A0A9P8YBG0_9PEZI|nr:uncharacterized protein B0I36DRAFT_360428 [Microdochium trichocladiopsis]KAH7034974.1 hypothetical protein B0I36DRAFT_360428 [Microdochium trichocladiopsis]